MANNETENKKIVAAKDTAAPAKTGELSEEDEALFRVRVSIPLTGENTIFTRSEAT